MRASDDRYEVSAGKVRGAVRLRLVHRDFLGQRDRSLPLGQSWLKWQRYKLAPSWPVCGLLVIAILLPLQIRGTSDLTPYCKASSSASSRYSVRCRCAKGIGPPGKRAARSWLASSNIEVKSSCRGDETRRIQASWENEL
jgi:hypothetical protein